MTMTSRLTAPGSGGGRTAGLLCALVATLGVTGCDGPPRFLSDVITTSPSPIPDPIDVRVDGQLLDLDSDAPISGAVVRLANLSTVTDQAGYFSLTASMLPGWQYAKLLVTRDGYEPAERSIAPDRATSLTLRAYPTLTIRPGESLNTSIPPDGGLTNNVCWFGIDDYWCRRVVVESSPGQIVDIELTSSDGTYQIGLIDSTQQPDISVYPRRLLVSGGQFWLVGGPGQATIVATQR